MASFKVNGITDVIKEYEMAAQKSPALCEKMVNAGAATAAETIRFYILKHDLVDSGKMFKSVKAGKITSKLGQYSCDVYPSGKDGKVRNAEKAFVNNYGTTGRVRKVPDTHFFDQAVEDMYESVPASMERVFDEEIGGK